MDESAYFLQDSVHMVAYHVAESINIIELKKEFTGKLISSTTSDLYYEFEDGGLLNVFSYGVVVFANIKDVEMSRTLNYLRSFCANIIGTRMDETYDVVVGEHIHFGYKALSVTSLSLDVLRMSMFNLAQSVALDYYGKISEELLTEVKKFTNQLVVKGKLNISKRNMLRFLGRTLNTKNLITENLYIFDSPEMVWEDEYLDKINSGLIKCFELRNRYREIESTFKSIEDNLHVFMEMYYHRESKMLEWIVIILILIEVINMFVSKVH